MTSPIWIPMPLHESWGKKIKSQNKELGHNLYLTFKYNHTKSKIKNKNKKESHCTREACVTRLVLYTILPYCSNKSIYLLSFEFIYSDDRNFLLCLLQTKCLIIVRINNFFSHYIYIFNLFHKQKYIVLIFACKMIIFVVFTLMNKEMIWTCVWDGNFAPLCLICPSLLPPTRIFPARQRW